MIFLNDFVPDWTAIPEGLFIIIKLSLFSTIFSSDSDLEMSGSLVPIKCRLKN